MKQHIKLFEEFENMSNGVLPDWAKPQATIGSIGHNVIHNSYDDYLEDSQSMANFCIGDKVRCVDPHSGSYGQVGSIVAFEDVTIRWKIENSDMRIGTDAIEYRCHPQHLQKII